MKTAAGFISKVLKYGRYLITYYTKRYQGIVVIDFELLTNAEHLEHNINRLFYQSVGPEFRKKMIVTVEENVKGLKQRCEVVLRSDKEKWGDCLEDCKKLLDKIEPLLLEVL